LRRIERAFFARDAVEVAHDLLGKVFVAGECSVRVVETEAYREDDPASHSHRGITRRNRVMFAEAGLLYVYFTYGMHHCANVVTGSTGEGSAVLIRAGEPLAGTALMRTRRGEPRREQDLSNGPAKLCQALGIDLSHNGADLSHSGTDPVDSPVFGIFDDGSRQPVRIGTSSRIGIRVGADLPWRFSVTGNRFVGHPNALTGQVSGSARRTSRP
jgi:DNA-3-methyladenine glycosylase